MPYRCCSIFRLWLTGAQSRNPSAKNPDFSRWQHPLCVTPKPTPGVLLWGSTAVKKPSLPWLLKTPAPTSRQWWLLVPTPDPRTETSLPSVSLSLHEVFLLGSLGLFERGALRFCPRSITHFCGAVLAAALSLPRRLQRTGQVPPSQAQPSFISALQKASFDSLQ